MINDVTRTAIDHKRQKDFWIFLKFKMWIFSAGFYGQDIQPTVYAE